MDSLAALMQQNTEEKIRCCNTDCFACRHRAETLFMPTAPLFLWLEIPRGLCHSGGQIKPLQSTQKTGRQKDLMLHFLCPSSPIDKLKARVIVRYREGLASHLRICRMDT